MNIVEKILLKTGPTRSSVIVEQLVRQAKISNEAARQRLSRAKNPIMKFPIPLLPKNEAFIYLRDQRETEHFWENLLKNLRETNAIYGAAIDGLINRGGTIEANEFPVISGAPKSLKKQVNCSRVIKNLTSAGIIETLDDGENEYITIARDELITPSPTYCKTLRLVENIILKGLHEWVRNLGLASYYKIKIRGDAKKPLIGSFMWDLTAPSYILPMKGKERKNGFLVADVFVKGKFEKKDIEYFIKKTKLLQSSQKNIKFIPILVAEAFDSNALKHGRSLGIMPVSINNIFGDQIGQNINALIETLTHAAATAIKNPQKLMEMLDSLSQIEGAMGNLRGVFFELMCVFLAKDGASSVDYSVKATDKKTGKRAEIDVLRILGKRKCIAIECKGKGPNGKVSEDEIRTWIGNLGTIRAYLNQKDRFSQASISFEFWTTGTFSKDAIALLKKEKAGRKKNPIDWNDGKDILNMAIKSKEPRIENALKQYYLNQPT